MDNVNAEAIVRALARIENPTVIDYEEGWLTCGLCNEDDENPKRELTHKVECPYRLSKEWIVDNPEPILLPALNSVIKEEIVKVRL